MFSPYHRFRFFFQKHHNGIKNLVGGKAGIRSLQTVIAVLHEVIGGKP